MKLKLPFFGPSHPSFKTLGRSYSSARRITKKKSIYMALYLRGRRDNDRLLSYYRKKHLGFGRL